MATLKETDLYPPIKTFLEGQGYEVKAEIGAADLVACRDGEEPVIVELKTAFSLALVHQGVERQALSDCVYLAVPRGAGRRFDKALAANLALCRRLGLGLLTVRLRDGFVEPHLDPGPYRPRISTPKRARLLREFARRAGDPNTGGASRARLVTAYRQDALRCAAHLGQAGPTKGAAVAAAAGVPRATRIMADDHYGWFARVATGIYDLTPAGRAALGQYAEVLRGL
ncbi:DUF2161 family putative PD-(D/E)XK-type phosphodiesterase [Actibacterium sp. MT2.3-13A]|uniref:DUF2161 domain-containing phosphodiesterase n=1 Tax=Actibacterium sp. MT2.3-13A TaxID=2828332 RepID=UPI001BA601CF|nr:DUF2161 family putative PD-(D/E)XK-type phosphodiesterase [Actibacterium sp. MT2.3-13A]